VSRNAQIHFVPALRPLAVAVAVGLAGLPVRAADSFGSHSTNALARVVMVENDDAISDFEPNAAPVEAMLDRGLTNLTGRAMVAAAWRSLVSTQDIIGIKVFSAAGQLGGTRPAVVAAVVQGLLGAGVPTNHIIIWDKREDDLRAAGYFKLGAQLGVRVASCVETGYDPTNFYEPDTAIIGNLLYGDLEFGKKGEGVGRKSFVSELVSRQITKIISVAPLLNQESAGVCGHLYGLALGSVACVAALFDGAEPIMVQPRPRGARHAGHQGTRTRTAGARGAGIQTEPGHLCQAFMPTPPCFNWA
jgi:hypothetical protein